MDDIAKAADVTKPVLYQHFSGKSELNGAVLDSCIELFEHQVVAPLLLDLDNQERTRRMISNFISVVTEDPTAYRMIFHSDMHTQEEYNEKIEGLVERVSERVGQTLRDNSDMSGEDCDFLGHTLVILAIRAAEVISIYPEPSRQKRCEQLLIKLVWGGVERIEEE